MLGLDASGFKKGRADAKVSLDQMRTDAQTAQNAIDEIKAKSAKAARANAAQEKLIADQIAAVKRNSTAQTKAEDTKQIKSLEAALQTKRAAAREEKAQTEAQIQSLRATLTQRKKSIKDTERGEKDQLDREKKQTQQTHDETGAIETLTGKVVGLFAAFTAGAGLTDFINSTLTGAAATGRLADNLGVDIEALGAWEGAVRRVGGAAADADSAIAALVKTRELIKAGQPAGMAQANVYNSLGITTQDLNDPIGVMTKLADKAKTMSKSQFSLRLGMIGFNQNAINALEKGGDALKALMDESRKAGVVDKDLAAKAMLAQDAMVNMADASRKLGQIMLAALAPSIQKAADWLAKFAEMAQQHMPAVIAGVAALTTVVVGLGVAVTASLIGPTLAAAAAFAPLIAALAAVGAGIAFLVSDFEKFRDTGKSAIDWSQFIPIWNNLKQAMVEVAAAGGQVIAAIPPGVIQFLGGVFRTLGTIIRDSVIIVLHGLIDALHIVRDVLKVIADLLQGNWSGAWKDAGKVLGDFAADAISKAHDVKEAWLDTWYAVTHHGQQRPRMSDIDSPSNNTLITSPLNTDPAALSAQWSNVAAQYAAIAKTPRNAHAGNVGAHAAMQAAMEWAGAAKIDAAGAADLSARWSKVAAEYAAQAKTARDPYADQVGAHSASLAAQQWSDRARQLASGGGNGSRADRNNNPGNLTDGRGQFLSFPTKEAGFAAMKRQLLIDARRGQTSVAAIINDPRHGWSNQWSPGNSARSTGNYIARVSKSLGVSPNQQLDLSNPDTLHRLALAMNAVERGSRLGGGVPDPTRQASNGPQSLKVLASYTIQPIDRGLNPGASASYAQHTTSNDNSSNVTATTHIGQIHVVAGDNANSVASGIETSLQNRSLAYNAASGLA
jgi:hypothetical protein